LRVQNRTERRPKARPQTLCAARSDWGHAQNSGPTNISTKAM